MNKYRLLPYAILLAAIIPAGCLGLLFVLNESYGAISHLRSAGRGEGSSVVIAGSMIWTIVSFFAAVLINIIFAAAVFRDATSLEHSGNPPELVGPPVWALATLFGGVFVAAAYWVINRSTLRRDRPLEGGYSDLSEWPSQPSKVAPSANEGEAAGGD